MLCKSLPNECTTGKSEPKASFLGVHSVQRGRGQCSLQCSAVTLFKSFASEQKTPHFHFELDPPNYGMWSRLCFSAKTADVFLLREEGDTDYGRGWTACAVCSG